MLDCTQSSLSWSVQLYLFFCRINLYTYLIEIETTSIMFHSLRGCDILSFLVHLNCCLMYRFWNFDYCSRYFANFFIHNITKNICEVYLLRFLLCRLAGGMISFSFFQIFPDWETTFGRRCSFDEKDAETSNSTFLQQHNQSSIVLYFYLWRMLVG